MVLGNQIILSGRTGGVCDTEGSASIEWMSGHQGSLRPSFFPYHPILSNHLGWTISIATGHSKILEIHKAFRSGIIDVNKNERVHWGVSLRRVFGVPAITFQARPFFFDVLDDLVPDMNRAQVE